MRAASFAEAILENVVRSFEEEHPHFQTQSAQGIELFFKVSKKLAFTNVDDERGAPDSLLFVVADETSEGRQHRDRQIVDAEISEILERVSRGRHSRATQAGDDYDVRDTHNLYLATSSGRFTFSAFDKET